MLRTRFTRRARRAFTLLEILLASVLAGLLLAALYAALYSTLLQTQVTRDAVEMEDLSRGVFNKFSLDLTGTLSPLPPKSGGNAAGSSGTVVAPTAEAAPTDGSGAGAAPAAGATGADSAAPAAADPTAAAADPAAADASTPGATDNATAVSADFAFQGGVVGEEGKLVIYAGRVPEAFGRYGITSEQVRPDQRQIIYWLEPGRGLYRRERPWVTADGVRNSIESDPDAPDSLLLAEEVTGLQFEYTDGTSGTWAGTWDGTAPGPDGVTPLGPPRAIRVTLELRLPQTRGEPLTKSVSQVIVIRSAPGTNTPPLLEAPTDDASDSSGTTDTSGTTGGASGAGATGGAAGGMSGGATGGTGGMGGAAGGSTRPSTGGGASGGGMTGGSTGAPSGGASGGGARPTGGSSGAGGGKR